MNLSWYTLKGDFSRNTQAKSKPLEPQTFWMRNIFMLQKFCQAPFFCSEIEFRKLGVEIHLSNKKCSRKSISAPLRCWYHLVKWNDNPLSAVEQKPPLHLSTKKCFLKTNKFSERTMFNSVPCAEKPQKTVSHNAMIFSIFGVVSRYVIACSRQKLIYFSMVFFIQQPGNL